ncbi:MAG: winged helix-turn-helix domain-containing protein, partial [Clostridium sp.]
KVWGYDYFGTDRIVDAQIKNLRKKLKSDVVKTIKGRGYLIE